MEIESQSGFNGLRVAAFESRQRDSMERLIQNYGGVALAVSSMREIPLEDNHEAFEFAHELLGNRIDVVIFLTVVGARLLIKTLETRHAQSQVIDALNKVVTVARGPKPLNALREFGILPKITIPEPNTWREILSILDSHQPNISLKNSRIAIQEYGAPSLELLNGLEERGAFVRRVPIYQWALPEDSAPLEKVIEDIIAGNVDVVIFTTSVQVNHLFQIAAQKQQEEALRSALQKTVIASIGPSTTETLKQYNLPSDFEPSHPKMGVLVKELAGQSSELIQNKIIHR